MSTKHISTRSPHAVQVKEEEPSDLTTPVKVTPQKSTESMLKAEVMPQDIKIEIKTETKIQGRKRSHDEGAEKPPEKKTKPTATVPFPSTLPPSSTTTADTHIDTTTRTKPPKVPTATAPVPPTLPPSSTTTADTHIDTTTPPFEWPSTPPPKQAIVDLCERMKFNIADIADIDAFVEGIKSIPMWRPSLFQGSLFDVNEYLAKKGYDGFGEAWSLAALYPYLPGCHEADRNLVKHMSDNTTPDKRQAFKDRCKEFLSQRKQILNLKDDRACAIRARMQAMLYVEMKPGHLVYVLEPNLGREPRHFLMGVVVDAEPYCIHKYLKASWGSKMFKGASNKKKLQERREALLTAIKALNTAVNVDTNEVSGYFLTEPAPPPTPLSISNAVQYIAGRARQRRQARQA